MLGRPYQGYLYAYPHKTAYRPLRPRPALADVWAGEPTGALFLYVHVPYCEMRCGFCNLFTRAHPPADHVRAYLRQLAVQASRVTAALPPSRYARAAIGGGTPTYLSAGELTALFDAVEATTGADLRAVPTSVETSPVTATADRLAVLVERGATRVSIGVQSFLDTEARAAGRPQRRVEVERALATIRAAGPVDLNIDLIYGIDGQTPATWEVSLRAALAWRPEELFLYPLYVRPLTGLGRRAGDPAAPGAARPGGRGGDAGADAAWDAQRMALYRQARDLLRAEGYRQLSMRAFRRADAPDTGGPAYCCQDDGMVGLGCGARSYTRRLHYSFDYAVSVRQVRAILDDYLRRPADDFAVAEVGFALDESERRRRWLLQSLLRSDGVVRADYIRRFGTEPDDDFPSLARLTEAGYAAADADRLRLTEMGLAHSDAIGPWLVPAAVRRAMAQHPTR